MQLHPALKGLLNKPFPYYDELAYVFRRYRAMGHFAETFTYVWSNEFIEYDGWKQYGASIHVQQGINMSKDDVRVSRLARVDPSERVEASMRVRLR